MSNPPMPTWLFALIAGILWLVGAGMYAIARHEDNKNRAFMSVARPATGKSVGYVIWKEKDPERLGRTHDKPVQQIEFVTEKGQTVRFLALSRGDYAFREWSAELGKEYSLLYDPNNPGRAQLIGVDKGASFAYASTGFAAIFAAVFTFLWLRRLSG